jgi:hypothetical protein
MRLFVVSGEKPPFSVTHLSGDRITAPQPPGPGLPKHAPSVKIRQFDIFRPSKLDYHYMNMNYPLEHLPANTQWIHDLARCEIYPEADLLLKSGSSLDPHQLIEESAIEFLTELRENFNQMIRTFNSYSEAGTHFQEIKIYNLAHTPAGFMLYRNQIKLVISNPAHGSIQISFAQHRTHPAAQQQNLPASDAPQELLAALGPFRDVYWTFQGEKVSAPQVARFYFTEFVRATRENRKARTQNQILVDQIKAFLQEKGLNL